MLDYRSPLILGAAPAGLALGAAAWLLVGGGALASSGISPLEARLAHGAPDSPAFRHASVDLIGDALSTPLFALTTGPGAVADVSLRLDGIARTPSHIAALISIGGKPSEWLELGQTRDDITLQEVQPSSVVVDTATGFKTVNLGETTPSASTSPANGQTQSAPGQSAQQSPPLNPPGQAQSARVPPVPPAGAPSGGAGA